MPLIAFTEHELAALRAVYTRAERVDWDAYDRARARILATPGQAAAPFSTVSTRSEDPSLRE
jgi:hypothetical protein